MRKQLDDQDRRIRTLERRQAKLGAAYTIAANASWQNSAAQQRQAVTQKRQVDDLTLIHGIGKVTAKNLNAVNVRTYDQVTQLSFDILRGLLSTLTKSRYAIIMASARALAEQKNVEQKT